MELSSSTDTKTESLSLRNQLVVSLELLHINDFHGLLNIGDGDLGGVD